MVIKLRRYPPKETSPVPAYGLYLARLSDRVAVMTGRPGRIQATFDVPLERPRDVYNIVDLPEFKSLRRELWRLLETDLEP